MTIATQKLDELSKEEFIEYVQNWGCSCDVMNGYDCGHITIIDELRRRLE